MAYFLSPKAEEDVINLFIDGTYNFGIAQAESYHWDLAQTFQLLSDFPESSPISPKFNDSIRIHPFKKHVIIYTIKATGDVLIVRVRHSRENWLTSSQS